MGQRYILPHLQHFRVLREGGNGIVLEVCMNLTMDSVIKYIFRFITMVIFMLLNVLLSDGEKY